MFTTTSLGQYQLTLFGVTSTTAATEIGANQQSLFLRPITASGAAANETSPKAAEVQPEAPSYDDWYSRMAEYRSAAGGSSSGVVSYGSAGGQTETTDSAETETQAGNGNGNGVGSNNGQSENAQAGASSSANNGNAASSGTGSGSTTSTSGAGSTESSGTSSSGSKGLLGFLFS